MDRLKELYRHRSKHSLYQILSTPLRNLLREEDLGVNSRYERERFDYIRENISIEGKSLFDIGGNTGYFTLESIHNGAKKVLYFEGNSSHAEFVTCAVDALDVKDKVKVMNEYFDFSPAAIVEKVDVCICLNVLHHIGDDFGSKTLSVGESKDLMIKAMKSLAQSCKYLVFQLGFNWMGDIDKPLFSNGTKRELIDFILSGVSETYDVVNIGIASKDSEGVVKYSNQCESNLMRDDSLGEFLNRPLFILKSK